MEMSDSRAVTLTDGNLEELAARSAEILRRGGVVLVPTETVYGLVCRYRDSAAEERIYRLKQREKSKRLAVFVGDWRKLDCFGVRLAGLPERLAAKYCPGAITIIAPCENGSTLGFRIPDHRFILELLKQVDFPLSSTSANASGEPNALTVEEALSQLSGPVDLAVDAGMIAPGALASTVVDACGETVRILRQGALKVEIS